MKMQASPQYLWNFYCDGTILACFLLPSGLKAADEFCNYLPKVTEAWLMNLNIDVCLRTMSSHLRIRLFLLSCVITTTKADAKNLGSSFAPQCPSSMTGLLMVSCVTEGYCVLFLSRYQMHLPSGENNNRYHSQSVAQYSVLQNRGVPLLTSIC